jgi:tellurite resistance protein TehA-like permease
VRCGVRLCAAKYGLLQACFAGAGVFFVATMLAAIAYMVRKKQIREKPVEAAKSTMQAALSDPMVLAAGLQIVRTIGLKRIVPIIAIGGIALGLMASRRQGDAEPSSEE